MRRRTVFFLIFVIILLLLLVFYLPAFSRYQELRQEEERIAREITELEQKIAELEREKELLLNDKEYLEKVIREELGLVRPGEILYKLVPESPETAQKSPPSPSPETN